MIIDAFSFYNELELLDIRLHELYDVVDRFVLVEATKTHSGLDKPLYYYDNAELFSEFADKILHIIVDDMPITRAELDACISGNDKKWIESKYQVEDSWVRERFQRNAIMRALYGRSPNDIIIISDADEIVKREIIREIRTNDVFHGDGIAEGSNAVEQTLNSYYLNVVCTNMPWYGSKIIYRKYLDIHTPSEVRFHVPATAYIKNGGQHYNYLGGEEKIKDKIKAFAHIEFNIPDVLDKVGNRLSNLTDVLGRLYQYKIIDMTPENTPQYVLDNQDKFSHLIYKG